MSAVPEILAYRQGLYDGQRRATVLLQRAIRSEASAHALLRHLGAAPAAIRDVLGQAAVEAERELPSAPPAERRLFAAELVLAALRLATTEATADPFAQAAE